MVPVVEKLLELGANVTVTNDKNQTARDIALLMQDQGLTRTAIIDMLTQALEQQKN